MKITNEPLKVTVIGTGNGGQAIAGYLAMEGHHVTLYGRNSELVQAIKEKGGITLSGTVEGFAAPDLITADLAEAVRGAEVIMIATTATAHGDLAVRMAELLEDEQIVVLNPGRTGGCLEFANTLRVLKAKKHIYLAEAQSLVFACRCTAPGEVNIIGEKSKVFIAALPTKDLDHVMHYVGRLFECFYPVENVLKTSFENIGPVIHPSIVLFNAAAIDRGDTFYFYRDLTPSIVDFIERLDKERLKLGRSYEMELTSLDDWIQYAYEGVEGNTLCERLQNNTAYYSILAPTSIHCRQLSEEICTGVVPMLEFGRIAGVHMPLFNSLVNISSYLLRENYFDTGRTAEKMGIDLVSYKGIRLLLDDSFIR